MRRTRSKMLAILLAVVLLLGVLTPVAAMAEPDVVLTESFVELEEASPAVFVDDALQFLLDLIVDAGKGHLVPSVQIMPFSDEPMIGIATTPQTPIVPAAGQITFNTTISRLPNAGDFGWVSGTFEIFYDASRLQFVNHSIPTNNPARFNTITHPAHEPGKITFNVGTTDFNHLFRDDATIQLHFNVLGVGGMATAGHQLRTGIIRDSFAGHTGDLSTVRNLFIQPITPDEFNYVWVGDGLLEVTVLGPAVPVHSSITVVHDGHSTNFTRNNNVFSTVVTTALEGYITASAPGFEAATVAIPAYVAGEAKMTITLEPRDTTDPTRGTLRGVVTGADTGLAIGGADVTVITAAGQEIVEQTGPDGRYVFTYLVPGEVTVFASASGYDSGLPQTLPVIIVANATAEADIALNPSSIVDPYTLTVIVDGPQPDVVTVSMDGVSFSRSGNVFITTTNSPLTGNVSVSAPLFYDVVEPVPAYTNNSAVIRVALEPIIIIPGTGGIQGVVTNATNGVHIQGATVVAIDANGVQVGSTVTNANGQYTIVNLAPGDHRIIVARAGFNSDSRDVEILADQIITENFALQPNGTGPDEFTLVVNLVGIEDAPATVWLNDTEMAFTNNVWSQTGNWPVTGTVRAVALGFLPSGNYVVVSDDYSQTNRVHVLNIVMESVDTPPAAGVLRGFVRQASNNITPIANATVTAIHADGTRHVTTSGIDGFYSFTNLPSGTYTVVASATGFNIGVADGYAVLTDSHGATANIYLSAGNNNSLLIVNVEPTSAVAGASLDLSGSPLQHVEGNTWHLVIGTIFNTTLTVSSNGFVTATRSINAASFTNNIAVVNVLLQPEATDGMLQGYVFEAGTTNRLAGATVTIVNNDTGATHETTANAEGFYRFTGLEPANYTVTAWASGFVASASANSPVTLVAGSGLHEDIHLARGAGTEYSLLVTVTGAAVDTVSLTMEDTTLTRVGTTNVWRAIANGPMLGIVTASAGNNYTPVSYTVTAGSYVDRVALVVLNLEEIGARVRFHFDGIYEDVLLVFDQALDTAQIPVPATRYGRIENGVSIPGQAFMGWFTQQNPIHTIGHADRAVAFDATQPISEATFNAMADTDGIIHLYGSWLQFGDVNGDGSIDAFDVILLNMFLGGALPLSGIIMQTANVTLTGSITPLDVVMLNMFLGGQEVILGPQQ